MDRLRPFLDDLESRIDENEEQANLLAWLDFLEGRCREDVFTPPRRTPRPPRIDWPRISVNRAFEDCESMLLHQFAACSKLLADGGSLRLCVRCNYSTAILPSLFGCGLFMMDEALDTLPTAIPLGSADRVRALLDRGVPDVSTGLGGKVFAAAEMFLDVMRRYERIGQHVALYHPDVQGPIDVAEVVWGSDIFYAFYDETELLRDFLELVTQTYTAFMRRWYALVPPAGAFSTHWGFMHRGRLMLREDSLMNLSPELYVEFIRPLDQRLFDEFGGGAIHFCGRGDHYIAPMSEMRGLYAVNLSQPHLNDMETICRHTVDRGIVLIGMSPEWVRQAGRPLLGRVQC